MSEDRGLYVVREESVPVEELRRGDTLILPSGRRVTVERVDRQKGGRFSVKWWRPAARGEPGFRGAMGDGRYLGTLMTVPAGYCWRVDRG